jgi:hypothetical protein
MSRPLRAITFCRGAAARPSYALSGFGALALLTLGPGAAADGLVAHASSCRVAPQTLPPGSRAAGGKTIRVHVGGIAYVVLVEPERYTLRPYPAEFPWRAPTSSDPRVLAAVHLCPQQGITSLLVRVAAFRAIRAGRAVLTAQLTPAWRRVRNGLRAYGARVTVVPTKHRSTAR